VEYFRGICRPLGPLQIDISKSAHKEAKATVKIPQLASRIARQDCTRPTSFILVEARRLVNAHKTNVALDFRPNRHDFCTSFRYNKRTVRVTRLGPGYESAEWHS